jgi:hypothetical protein
MTVRRAALVYTAGRFLLFMLFAMLSWSVAGLLGYRLNGFPLLVLALLLSSVAGYFLLAVPREQLASAIAAQRESREP